VVLRGGSGDIFRIFVSGPPPSPQTPLPTPFKGSWVRVWERELRSAGETPVPLAPGSLSQKTFGKASFCNRHKWSPQLRKPPRLRLPPDVFSSFSLKNLKKFEKNQKAANDVTKGVIAIYGSEQLLISCCFLDGRPRPPLYQGGWPKRQN